MWGRGKTTFPKITVSIKGGGRGFGIIKGVEIKKGYGGVFLGGGARGGSRECLVLSVLPSAPFLGAYK